MQRSVSTPKVVGHQQMHCGSFALRDSSVGVRLGSAARTEAVRVGGRSDGPPYVGVGSIPCDLSDIVFALEVCMHDHGSFENDVRKYHGCGGAQDLARYVEWTIGHTQFSLVTDLVSAPEECQSVSLLGSV